MKPSESDIKLHVFVCTNKKPAGKACCEDRGGKEVRDKLKALISARPELASKVRINASGCLDKCSEGVVCVIYPQGEWLTNVSVADLPQLEELIAKKASEV